MASKRRFCALLVLAGIAAAIAGRAAFADPVPGDACTGAGNYTASSGPELSGAGHLMVCSGSVWKSVVDFDATANSTLPYALNLSGDITPTALAANTNDWAPANLSTASVIRMSASAAYNLTGLTGGADGRIISLINVGTNTVTLKANDLGSTAANRFGMSANLALAASQGTMLVYDSTASLWRLVGADGASSSGSSSAPTVQVFTAGGTWTRPSGVAQVEVYATGSGGGGGVGPLGASGGGGGGAGGTAVCIIDVTSISSAAVVVAAGGASGAAGGSSSFNGAGCSGSGGAGGSSNVAGSGAAASGGTINLTGGAGGGAGGSSGGNGGSSYWGGGGRGGTGAGGAGTAYGSGGGGGVNTNAGGVGKAGVVVVKEYYGSGGGGGSADNLGDHTATQNIQLGSNWLSGDGSNEGITIGSDGYTSVNHSGGHDSMFMVGDGNLAAPFVTLALGTDAVITRPTMSFRGSGDISIIGQDSSDYLAFATESSQAGIAFKVNGNYLDANFLNTAPLVPMTISTTGKVDLANAVSMSGDITPTALAANTNDWAPANLATASVIRMSASSAVNLTGLTGGADGRTLTLLNVGSATITFTSADTSSAAANQFALGSDIAISPDRSISVIYDATSQRWRAAGFPFDAALARGYFVQTLSKWNGNLGGLSGADAKCLTELQTTYDWKGKANAGTLSAGRVKAFLCDGTTCNNLLPSTWYMFAKANSTTLGGQAFITNASGQGPDTQSLWDDGNWNSASNSWSNRAAGTAALWGTTPAGATHCSNWGSTAGNGVEANAGWTNTKRWNNGTTACTATNFLMCFVNP